MTLARNNRDAIRLAGTRVALASDVRALFLDQSRPPAPSDTGFLVDGAGAVDVRCASCPRPGYQWFIASFDRADIVFGATDFFFNLAKIGDALTIQALIDGATGGAASIDEWLALIVAAAEVDIAAQSIDGTCTLADLDGDGLDDAVVWELPRDPADPWVWDGINWGEGIVYYPPTGWSIRVWSRSSAGDLANGGAYGRDVNGWAVLADLGPIGDESAEYRLEVPARSEIWIEHYAVAADGYAWSDGLSGDWIVTPLISSVALASVIP